MKIDFEKSNGLIPVIIQHYATHQVLMLGYMNDRAWKQTQKEKRVTFFSRSKNRLWTKGETSGKYLELKSFAVDCDQDTLLLKVKPKSSTCHTGCYSCFGDKDAKGFIQELQKVIHSRKTGPEGSYTYNLFQSGINKIAQKLGEEAVELVIEAKDDSESLFLNEGADLLYHLLVLLSYKGYSFEDLEKVLLQRHTEY